MIFDDVLEGECGGEHLMWRGTPAVTVWPVPTPMQLRVALRAGQALTYVAQAPLSRAQVSCKPVCVSVGLLVLFC